jgi:hypothetical protein
VAKAVVALCAAAEPSGSACGVLLEVGSSVLQSVVCVFVPVVPPHSPRRATPAWPGRNRSRAGHTHPSEAQNNELSNELSNELRTQERLSL